MAVVIKASDLVNAGQSFMSLRCDPTGWLDNASTRFLSGTDLVAQIDVSIAALAIDPSSDFDIAPVYYASPQSILAGGVTAAAPRYLGVGSPLVGTVISNPGATSQPTFPPPNGQQILVGQFATGWRQFGVIDPTLAAYFATRGQGMPQLIVNAYFKMPSVLPISRPHRALSSDPSDPFTIALTNVPQSIARIPFFGRSRLSVGVINKGALTANLKVDTFGVYFATDFPSTVPIGIQVDSQTIVSPGGIMRLNLTNQMFDAFEIVVTGHAGDKGRLLGYVADATQP
jgi:hypothetical protein